MIDEKRLEAIISQQIALARDHDKKEREAGRAKALDYFLGRMDAYIPPEPNRSRAISRDVADTIGWMLPGIMRVFTASDRMAVAEPVGEEDIEWARQATDALNYVFWKDNRGYEVVYNATWDSLLFGNGIVKTYYDDTPIYTTSFHSSLSLEQVAVLLEKDQDGEAPEILQQAERPIVMMDPDTGETIQSSLYDLKIRRKKASGQFVVEAIPPEKFLIDGDAISTADAAFAAHWERRTRSDLVAMGYPKDDVAAIPASGSNQTAEEQARSDSFGESGVEASMELVDYFECFVRIDIDEDGEAELVRACFGGLDGGKLLDWEVWEDEHPFDDIPCEPLPHRWSARSAADETIDVQDIKSVLIRQALNNIYATNKPQRFVVGSIENEEELLTPTFGGLIKGAMGSMVTDLTVPFVAGHAFEAMAYQDEVVQRRTGVGRGTMALDPQALQNQTAEAVREGKDAGYSQIELVARNQSEWGWKKVFRKLLRLLIKHQDRPRDFMMNGKKVTIDPRYWNADMDVTINIGLGTGSRDRDLMMLGQILNTQQAMLDRFMGANAVDEAVDMLPRILRTMVKMAESAGIRNPEDFYPEYTAEKVAALKQAAAQRASQGDPKVAADAQKAQAQMQIDVKKAEMDATLQREKLAAEIQLRREQMAAEMQLRREQMAAEIEMKREMNAASMAFKGAGLTGVRMGGEIG